MAHYRMFLHEFWTDHRLLKLSTQKRTKEILVINYVVTGPLACKDINISGIYYIDLGSFEAYCGLSHEEIFDILTFLNVKLSDILEYDFQNKIIFIKKFFIEQAGYKPGLSIIPDLIKNYQSTKDIVPHFWKEFSEKNSTSLRSLLDKVQHPNPTVSSAKSLNEDEKNKQVNFLINLLDLKDSALPAIKFSDKNCYEQISLF